MHLMKTAAVKFKRPTKKTDFSNYQTILLTGLLILVLTLVLLFGQPPWLIKFLQTLNQLFQVISEFLSGKLYIYSVTVFGEEPVKISAEVKPCTVHPFYVAFVRGNS